MKKGVYKPKNAIARLLEVKKVKGATVDEYVHMLLTLSKEALEDKEVKAVAKIFSALSDPTRIKILKVLERRKMCVCELMIALGLSQPTTSYHLKLLQTCGLIKPVKRGKWTFYEIANRKLVRLIFKIAQLI